MIYLALELVPVPPHGAQINDRAPRKDFAQTGDGQGHGKSEQGLIIKFIIAIGKSFQSRLPFSVEHFIAVVETCGTLIAVE